MEERGRQAYMIRYEEAPSVYPRTIDSEKNRAMFEKSVMDAELHARLKSAGLIRSIRQSGPSTVTLGRQRCLGIAALRQRGKAQ